MPVTKPQVVIDTNAVMSLSSGLAQSNVDAGRILRDPAFPEVVLTQTIGSEMFGKNGFDTAGGPNSIIQGVDGAGHIKFKSWEETKRILEKNPMPSARDISPREYMEQAKREYDMLNTLAESDKLTLQKTPTDGMKRHSTNQFSGYDPDLGERSMAEAEAALRRKNPNVFVVTNDKKTILDIANLPGNEGHKPGIMNTSDFVYALEGGGIVSSPERQAISRKLSGAPKTDVIVYGPKHMYDTADRSPDALGDAIKGDASRTARAATVGSNGAGQSQASGPQRVPQPGKPAAPGEERPRVLTKAQDVVVINGGGTNGANALKPNIQPDPPPGLFAVPKPGQEPPEKQPPNNVIRMPKKPSPLGDAAGAGMSGYLTYSGVLQVAKGVDELNSGDKLRSAADLGIGGLNTAAGIGGIAEYVSPGAIEKIAGRRLAERLEYAAPVIGPILMAADAAYDISTAPAGKKGEAAYKKTGSLGPAVLMMGSEGAGAIFLPVGAAILGGVAVNRDITLTNLQKDHKKAMRDIVPDAAHSHLRAEADKLQNTLMLAQFGDILAKDDKGMVDTQSQANLDRIKASLPPDKLQELERKSVEAAEAQFEQIKRISKDLETRTDAFSHFSEKQVQEWKAKAAHENETAVLKGMGEEIQEASQARHDYFPPDAKLALDASGKVSLDPENLKVLREVLSRKHDDLQNAFVNTSQISAYWNIPSGEATLREHIAQEEQLKKSDTALSELNNMQFGGTPLDISSVSREQRAQDIERLKTESDPNKIAAFIVTVQRDENGKIAGDPMVDARVDKTFLDAAIKEYESNPQKYQAQGGVVPVPLYKMDDQHHLILDEHGKPIAEKLVLWKVVDSDLRQEMAQEKTTADKPEQAVSPMERAKQQADAVKQANAALDHKEASGMQPPDPAMIAAARQNGAGTPVRV